MVSCDGLSEGKEGRGRGGKKATDGWENRLGEGERERRERTKYIYIITKIILLFTPIK